MGGYLSKKEENEDALANDWGLMVHLQRIGVGVPLKCLERAFPSSGEYLSSTAPSMKRALDMVMSKACCQFWQIGIVLVAVQGLGDWPHVLGQSVAESSERETLFRRYLQEHCASCHNQDQKEGNLTLDSFTGFEEASRSPDHWWKVLKNVRAGLMPPLGEPKPTDAEQKEFVDAIKYSIFKIDPRSPDPGRLTVRRLNRTEYANTIRDLMGVRFEAEILFPPDDSGHGFDNIGERLRNSIGFGSNGLNNFESYRATAFKSITCSSDLAIPCIDHQSRYFVSSSSSIMTTIRNAFRVVTHCAHR